ncbi:hypothetical protein ABVS_1709 [Acinetobacter lwoffii]|nr:hypothetical protein ABVS_1709 [Acinetobacter lwoffii]
MYQAVTQWSSISAGLVRTAMTFPFSFLKADEPKILFQFIIFYQSA